MSKYTFIKKHPLLLELKYNRQDWVLYIETAISSLMKEHHGYALDIYKNKGELDLRKEVILIANNSILISLLSRIFYTQDILEIIEDDIESFIDFVKPSGRGRSKKEYARACYFIINKLFTKFDIRDCNFYNHVKEEYREDLLDIMDMCIEDRYKDMEEFYEMTCYRIPYYGHYGNWIIDGYSYLKVKTSYILEVPSKYTKDDKTGLYKTYIDVLYSGGYPPNNALSLLSGFYKKKQSINTITQSI